ncbi:MAG TPA: BTAD domain-containing putative transcriptional regulator [Symbiobacteriaceae bacterium]|jgi:DNA-binding SARP family transcriptional activator
MFGEDQVLRAKLLPPRPRRHTLVRRRLQERLSEALEVPLTILHAGPGYGKTTALASFLAGQTCVTAWYAISEGDGDLLPFLLHFIYALREQNLLIGDKALSILQEGQGPNRPWDLAAAALINDLVVSSGSTETLIVLDDFHVVDESPAILAIVEHLVEHLPPQVHLLLATRRRPSLPGLPRWRARAEVLELGQADLAFTPEEVHALFRDQYGFDLTVHQADGLAGRTEGWIIALQLIWQGLRKGSALLQGWDGLPNSLEGLFTYLAQEVLDRQKPFVRRFLLATAALERLEPAVCDALIGEPGSASVLVALEENGLFTQAIGSGVWRYHQLFHQFLRESARRDAAAWQAHHLIAAQYFAAAGAEAEAAGHYLSAGEPDAAALRLLRAAGLLETGRVDVLGGLLERLGDETYGRYPELLLRRGDVARLTSRFDEALRHYGQAAGAYRAAGDGRGLCLALMGQGRVYLDTISPGDAEGLFQEALQLAGALGEEERAQLMALVAENATNSGRPVDAEHFARLAAGRAPLAEDLEVRALLRTGRLAAAMGILDRQARGGAAGADGASRSHREVPLLISLIASFTGDAERARAAAEEGIRRGREKRSPFVEGVGFIRLGHALQMNPLTPINDVAEQYQRAIAVMDGLKVVRGKSEPLAGLCTLYGHAAGDWALAEQYGQQGAEIAAAARDNWFFAFCLLSLGSSAVAVGRPEADGYLRRSEAAFESAGDPHGLALARLWQAMLAHRRADWTAFDGAIGQALATAQANGYGFLFTRRTLFGPRDPQALIPILSEAHRRRVMADYAAWLLAERGIPNPESHPGFTLRVRALGDFQVWRGNQEITRREWQREKARQLLQLLVTCRRRMLQKEQLIDLLWPGADPDTAARDFKVAHNALVTALEPNRTARSGSFYILRSGTAYGLDPAVGYWLDADEFERLAGLGLALAERGQEPEAAESLRRALDLYQGDFLQDVPYEDWCSEERERLQVLYLRAAEWLAQRAVREGDYEGCIRTCDRILARDPCWEEAFRLLMRSYYRLGNRAMALRTYDKCAQNLQAELGVRPMPATQQLYERIRKSAETLV